MVTVTEGKRGERGTPTITKMVEGTLGKVDFDDGKVTLRWKVAAMQFVEATHIVAYFAKKLANAGVEYETHDENGKMATYGIPIGYVMYHHLSTDDEGASTLTFKADEEDLTLRSDQFAYLRKKSMRLKLMRRVMDDDEG